MREFVLILLLALSASSLGFDNYEVSEKEDTSVQSWWSPLAPLTDILARMRDTITHTIYKRVLEVTDMFNNRVSEYTNMFYEFRDEVYKRVSKYTEHFKELGEKVYERVSEVADNIRSAVHDGIYDVLESVWEWSMNALFTEPDTLLGKFSQAVANKIMAVGLIFICLVLDYIFWRLYLSILFILAFDGAILLMFKLWGPARVYSKFWYAIRYFFNFLSFIWTYPYISSFVIVVLFILSVVRLVVRYSTYRSREKKVDTIEKTILSLSVRLKRMEERQEQMLELLLDMREASVQAGDSE